MQAPSQGQSTTWLRSVPTSLTSSPLAYPALSIWDILLSAHLVAAPPFHSCLSPKVTSSKASPDYLPYRCAHPALPHPSVSFPYFIFFATLTPFISESLKCFLPHYKVSSINLGTFVLFPPVLLVSREYLALDRYLSNICWTKEVIQSVT